MNKNDITDFIVQNKINKNTLVVFTINENGQQIEYKGRFEFNFNGTPAISDDKIGIRIQMIKDASDMPYIGGLSFENLINVKSYE
jgi:hypothetical protein